MNHFDMNPDNLDPRVRQAQKARLKERRINGFMIWFVFCGLFGLIFFGTICYVAGHFVGKYW